MAKTDMRAIVSTLNAADGGIVERCLGYIGADWGDEGTVGLSIFSSDFSKPLVPACFAYQGANRGLEGRLYNFVIGTEGGKMRCFKVVHKGWQLDVYDDDGKLEFSAVLSVSPDMRAFLESLETAYRAHSH